LVAYLFQTAAWGVLWPSRWKAEPPLEKIRSQEVPVLSGCLALTVVSYMALQAWLLDTSAFPLVAAAVSVGLAALAWRWVKEPGLRETTVLLSIFSTTAALVHNDLPETVSTLGVFAQGALMVLTSRPGSLRRVIAYGLSTVGALALCWTSEGIVGPGLVMVCAFAMSMQGARVD